MISWSFRLDGTGRVASVDPRSDDGQAQRIAEVCRTIKGERPLAVFFGIEDPTWRGLNVSDVAIQVATYGPFDVVVQGIESAPGPNMTQQILVTFGQR